jgi:uncharacterized protein (DUF4415 family)
MKKQSTATISDDAPALSRANIDAGKLVLRKRAPTGKLLPNKQRVNIFIDRAVIEHFKAKAGERGYQTLINESLKQAMLGESLAETVRKTISQELRRAKKTA